MPFSGSLAAPADSELLLLSGAGDSLPLVCTHVGNSRNLWGGHRHIPGKQLERKEDLLLDGRCR